MRRTTSRFAAPIVLVSLLAGIAPVRHPAHTARAAGPAFVQVAAAVPQSPQSVVSVAYPLPQQAGDTNILAIGWNDTAASVTSVTDSAGNVYRLAVPAVTGGGLARAIYLPPTSDPVPTP